MSRQRLRPGVARSDSAEERPEKARHLHEPAAGNGIPYASRRLTPPRPRGCPEARPGPGRRNRSPFPRPSGAPAGRCGHVRRRSGHFRVYSRLPSGAVRASSAAPPLPRPPRAHWRPAPPTRQGRRPLPRAGPRGNAPLPLRGARGGGGATAPPRRTRGAAALPAAPPPAPPPEQSLKGHGGQAAERRGTRAGVWCPGRPGRGPACGARWRSACPLRRRGGGARSDERAGKGGRTTASRTSWFSPQPPKPR